MKDHVLATDSIYDAIKKADIVGFRKEYMNAGLDYLKHTKNRTYDQVYEDELTFIHEQLMEANAYI